MRVSLCLSGREMWRGMKIEEKRTLMLMIVWSLGWGRIAVGKTNEMNSPSGQGRKPEWGSSYFVG